MTVRVNLRPRLVLVAVLLTYIVLIKAIPYEFNNTRYPYYVELADRILEGGLDVTPNRDHDLSLYKGKWYLYWGIAPVFLVIPGRALLGESYTDRLASYLVGLMTILVWVAVLFKLRDQYPSLSDPDIYLLAVFAVLGTMSSYQIATGTVWLYTHVAATFYTSIALYFSLNKKLVYHVLAILFFGLACNCRASLFLMIPIFVLHSVVKVGIVSTLISIRSDFGTRRASKDLRLVLCSVSMLGFAALAPVLLQLWYNWARFDSIFEFGFKLQNDATQFRKDYLQHGLVSFHFFVRNFFTYLVNPVEYVGQFPFIRYDLNGNAIWSYQFGVFIPVFAALHSIRYSANHHFGATFWFSFVIWLAYFVFLLFLYSVGWMSFGGRYLADILPFMVVLIAISYAKIRNSTPLRIICITLLFGSILVATLANRSFATLEGGG